MRGSSDHAVVVGASMAGLLATRVLADEFGQVTLLERDQLPSGREHRRGVPQDRHVHALLPGGARVLDELFPGLLADLRSGGAPLITDLSQLYFDVGGHLFSRQPYPSDRILQPSRTYLESEVRARVRALANVEVRDERDVVGVTAPPDGRRVTGVRTASRGADTVAEAVDADLVVDATGRGGRAETWLRELGFPTPRQELVKVGVKYVTQPVRLAPDAVPEVTVMVGPVAGRLTGMGVFAVEDETWLFGLVGYRGHHPPTDHAERLEFAAAMAPPRVLAALRDAEPLGDVVGHQFPSSQRRHYEELPRFPTGLLVLGDALCSFNPIYGQGMSVAALQSLALRTCLREPAGTDEDLAARFFRAAAGPVDVAWQMAVGGDLSLPEVEGPRPVPVRLLGWYVDRFQAAAETDSVLARRFLRVQGFVDPPTALFHPATLRRVAAGNRRRRARARTPAAGNR